ncbi:MAG TPA: hypothetical protein VIZ30_04215 [Pseudomonadales bacterium]
MKTAHTLKFAAASICLAWIAPAFADIALTTTVQKLERIVAPDGTVSSQLAPAEKVVPGDDMHYTITFANDGDKPIDAGTAIITNPVPENTQYLSDTAFGSGTTIQFSVDGGKTFGPANELTVVRDGQTVAASSADYTTIRWVFGPALAPAAQSHVSFNVRLK